MNGMELGGRTLRVEYGRNRSGGGAGRGYRGVAERRYEPRGRGGGATHK